jgi:4-hydroxybenzoate polyprenyltransferase
MPFILLGKKTAKSKPKVRTTPKVDEILGRFVPGKVKAIIELIRPFTLLAPIIGGTSAALISLKVNGGEIPWPIITSYYPFIRWDFPQILTLIWGVLALVFVNAASNSLNQATDLDVDKINKPYRPIPRGDLTKDEARTVAWFFYLMTLWRASWVNRSFAFFILLIMLMTICYSVPPIQFKKRLWISNLSIAATRGLLGFVAAWCIFDDNPFDNPTPWAMGLIMSVFIFGTITSKDFTDIDGDKAFGMRTIPVVYGLKKAALFTAMFFVLPFFLIPVLMYMHYLIPQTFIMTVMVAWGIYVLILINEAVHKKEDKVLENSPVWKHMYLMLLALQLEFLTIYYLYY